MTTCRNIANDVANGRLSKEELDDIMDRLERAEGGIQGKMAEARRAGDDAELAALIEKRNRLQNIVAERRLMALVDAADEAAGRPALGLQAALVGINTPIEGAQRSVDAVASGIMNSWAGGMIVDLKRLGLERAFRNMTGDLEREVARAMSDLNRAKPRGVKVSADARAMAEIMVKYQEAARQRQNRAGAYIRKREGYVVRQSHDPARLQRAGLEAWKNNVRQKLDFEAMGVGIREIEDFLDSAFVAIKSGIRLTQQVSDLDRSFTGPGNLAKKDSASRVLLFKSADGWMDYHNEFGSGSLVETYLGGLSGAARSAALMDTFGTNPQAMMDRVIQKIERKHRADEGKLKGLRGGVENLQAAMDEVTGDVNIGASSTVARVAQSYRALQTMAKLGGAFVSALSDIAFVATNRVYQGRSIMDAWGDALTASTEGLSRGDKREFADLMGAGLEGQLGDFMSRFNAQDTVPGRTSKLMATFFRLNLLGPWTDANKRGVTFMISRDLAHNAERGWGDLPSDIKRLLELYGIDARGWEVARKAVREGPDGRQYLMPGDVEGATGAPFTGLTRAQQTKLRDRVRDSLFALLSTEADYAVPSPGARERGIMRRGYRPGTPAGEAVRFVGQFKSFSVTALTKVMGRQIHGHAGGPKIFGNTGLVNAIVATTVLGYFVLQSKELLKGRNPRPPSAKTFIASALQGGGLGIYGDFLFGTANRFGGGTLETVVGPGLGTIADVVDTLQLARQGEASPADAIRIAKQNLPFANLFYTKSAMDYLVWFNLQEMANPGYLRRMERRIERENNQTFWLPPTSVVRTGGGLR